MLSFACAIAVLGQSSVEFTIPVRYDTPSHLVELMRGGPGNPPLISTTVRMAAIDSGRIIRVQGTADELMAVRQFVKVMDVVHPKAQIKIHIETPTDRAGYDVTTSVRSNKTWKMSDEATGLTISLNPILGSDNTTTLKFVVDYPGGSREQMIRLKNAEKYVLDLGTNKSITGWQSKEGEMDVTSEERALPKLTFQVTRTKSK